jgi:hypothetical protein
MKSRGCEPDPSRLVALSCEGKIGFQESIGTGFQIVLAGRRVVAAKLLWIPAFAGMTKDLGNRAGVHGSL